MHRNLFRMQDETDYNNSIVNWLGRTNALHCQSQHKSTWTLTTIRTCELDLPVDGSDVIFIPYDKEHGIVRHRRSNVTWQASRSFHHCLDVRYGACKEEWNCLTIVFCVIHFLVQQRFQNCFEREGTYKWRIGKDFVGNIWANFPRGT